MILIFDLAMIELNQLDLFQHPRRTPSQGASCTACCACVLAVCVPAVFVGHAVCVGMRMQHAAQPALLALSCKLQGGPSRKDVCGHRSASAPTAASTRARLHAPPPTHPPTQVKEASKVYGVTTLEHPAVQMISMERGRFYLGGKVEVSAAHAPQHGCGCGCGPDGCGYLGVEATIELAPCRSRLLCNEPLVR